MVFAHVMVLTCDGWWRGSQGLSARRARRTKGLQLDFYLNICQIGRLLKALSALTVLTANWLIMSEL